jgi:AsnC-type helix-turn-helix domain
VPETTAPAAARLTWRSPVRAQLAADVLVLRQHGRLSFAAIGRELGLSRQAAWETYERQVGRPPREPASAALVLARVPPVRVSAPPGGAPATG